MKVGAILRLALSNKANTCECFVKVSFVFFSNTGGVLLIKLSTEVF